MSFNATKSSPKHDPFKEKTIEYGSMFQKSIKLEYGTFQNPMNCNVSE